MASILANLLALAYSNGVLEEEMRFTLYVTGDKASPDVVGRFKSMMLMMGGRAGRLDQPLLEAELGCRMQTSVVRTVT